MSEGWKSAIARRPLLAGLVGVLGLGVAGGLVYEIPRLGRRQYKRTQFDDLLAQLDDRESAIRLGAAVTAEEPGFDAAMAARALRQGAGRGSLSRAVTADIAQGRLRIVHGWLVPESLALVAGIALKSS
jgi:hypothetical protein